MLRIHFMQPWYALSDPAMEDALYEIESMRRFAGLALNEDAIPDETRILKLRRLLEQHGLAAKILEAVNAHLGRQGLLLRQGTIVDATIIQAPSSTKNRDKPRDPDMHQSKKGQPWYFGMKAHMARGHPAGVDMESGLVHTVTGTAANVSDISEAANLLHGEEETACADACYTGVEKREEHQDREVEWFVAARRGTIEAMAQGAYKDAVKRFEYLKAVMRSKVEHSFRVIKRQFGYVKVRYKGLAKNTAQVKTVFALSNLWMARHRLSTMREDVRPMVARWGRFRKRDYFERQARFLESKVIFLRVRKDVECFSRLNVIDQRIPSHEYLHSLTRSPVD